MNKAKASIGQKDQLLTIQRAIVTQDTDGSVLKEWVEYKQVWGDVRALTGSESYIAQGVSSELQYSIPIRYAEGIIPEMRVVAGSRTFEITAVKPGGRNGELELLCTE